MLPLQSIKEHPEIWTPERLAFLIPAYDKQGKLLYYEGSMRTDIAYAKSKGELYAGRMDIVLISDYVKCTCSKCGNVHSDLRQYTVYPGPNGTITGKGVEKLSPEDREWAIAESRKCWEVSELREIIK